MNLVSITIIIDNNRESSVYYDHYLIIYWLAIDYRFTYFYTKHTDVDIRESILVRNHNNIIKIRKINKDFINLDCGFARQIRVVVRE